MDAITEKIIKLLRLGQSSNPHEAELALQRAFQIAEKNHIDLASLELDPDLKKIAVHAYHVGRRISTIRKLAMVVVGKFFNVSHVIPYPAIDFVGTASDVEIAIHVFEFLTRRCGRDLLRARKQAGRRFSRTRRLNFLSGWFYGVTNNLRGARQEILAAHAQYALVIQSEEKRREQWIDDNLKTHSVKLLAPVRRDRDALMLGHRYGSEVQINTPLPRASAPLALLGGAA